MASELCGQAGYKLKGQEHESEHDVMAPEMIRQLPGQHALVVRGGLAPVIARLPMAWKDRLYKKARRGGWATYPAYAKTGRGIRSVPLRDTGPGKVLEPVGGPADDDGTYSWNAGPDEH
jgi:hypothetical protein